MQIIGSVANNTVHKIGCRCRKSMCLKKYCECFQAAVACSGSCTCLHCCNTVAAHATGQLYEYQKLLKVPSKTGTSNNNNNTVEYVNSDADYGGNNNSIGNDTSNSYTGKKYYKNSNSNNNSNLILQSMTNSNLDGNTTNSNYSGKVSSESLQCNTLLKDEYLERAATDLVSYIAYIACIVCIVSMLCIVVVCVYCMCNSDYYVYTSNYIAT